MANNTPFIAGASRDESAAGSFNLREALTIVMERIWIGVAVAVAVFLVFWLNAHRQTPYYRSTARLIVEAQMPQIFNFQDVLSFNTRNLEYFNTHINALHSRAMMEKALHSSGLAGDAAFLPGFADPAARVSAALALVKISPVERTRMINISVEHPNPEVASRLANALARSYIQQDLDNRMNASLQAVDWLRSRTDEFRQKLEQGLAQLQEYRESTQSVSLEEDQNIVIVKLKALNGALTAAETGRIEAETRWRSVEAQAVQGIPLSQMPVILAEDSVAQARRQWQNQLARVDELGLRYRPGYPDLQQAIEDAKRAEQQFLSACENARQTLKGRYEMLKEQEASLKKALGEQEKLSFELDRKLVRYNDLKRNIEADEQVYQAMISRMKEASLAGSLPTQLIRIAEEAQPARAPFRPDYKQAMLRGALLGLVLGLGAIFLVYIADHRFRRAEEVERRLGVPVLGTVPFIEASSVAERGLATHLDHGGEVAESFRTLRASLMLNAGTREARVMMVTSPHAAEGKSLVSVNLAVCFAQDGRRTLLVGCDLRRPVIEKIFGAKGLKGLSEVLRGELEWRGALLKHDIPNLDVLCSGSLPSRPTEMLGGARFSDFLAEARTQYERIVIDAPPVLGLSDALVLLPRSDSVLFVVRYGVTHSLSASHAMRKIEPSGTPCHGVVLNGVNLKSLANAYYYRRYGNYTYQPRGGEAGASTSTQAP